MSSSPVSAAAMVPNPEVGGKSLAPFCRPRTADATLRTMLTLRVKDATQRSARPDTVHRNSSSQRASLLQQAVRFASGVTEINPSTGPAESFNADDDQEEMSPEQKEEIRKMAMSAQKSRMQQSRMGGFAFEPVSLPPSQVS